MKVLHDPTKEATVAGMKAALPYERALQTIEKRVSDYETRALGLSNQARSLRTVAKGMADGAVAKQAGGALKAASKDMIHQSSFLFYCGAPPSRLPIQVCLEASKIHRYILSDTTHIANAY